MKVSDIMTLNPKVCMPDDNVAVAVALMWDYDCGAIPVVTDLESKKLAGIVTDRDIAMHIVRHAFIHPAEVKVGDCMSHNVVSCFHDDLIERIIQQMSEYRVRRIPVVDKDGSCIGIVSQTDLLSRADEIGQSLMDMLQKVSTRCAENSDEPIASGTNEKETVEEQL